MFKNWCFSIYRKRMSYRKIKKELGIAYRKDLEKKRKKKLNE